ncbi:hypothetical protein [Neobacillus sp. D3-1R]|uniref:hypothetical protein n=1 Tax=Neobacillus sp. D3-1R TaxID=3445778 RepID=UPI003F9EBF1A
MGLIDTFLHLEVTALEKSFLKKEVLKTCQKCNGIGFMMVSNSNVRFPFDNGSKCSACKGVGYELP